MVRITAAFWVSAYRKRLDQIGIPCFVVRRGDETAGAIFIKVCRMDGTATVFQKSFDALTGQQIWTVLVDDIETVCDAALDRQKRFDPDLWILEIEDKQGRHLLETLEIS